jgi:hypothetical protein
MVCFDEQIFDVLFLGGKGAVLGFELRASHSLGHFSHSTSPFFVSVLGIFEIGSLKLFTQAGFEPRSS